MLEARTEGMGLNAVVRVFKNAKNTVLAWERKFESMHQVLLVYSLVQTFLQMVLEGDGASTKVGKNVPPEESFFVKQCTLAGIYYGAFEALGPIQEVKKRPVAERCAPVFDLTPFASLLDWTIGIDRFLNAGDASLISALTAQNIQPILKATQGQDAYASNLRNLAKAMLEFSQQISTCRGKNLSQSALRVQEYLTDAICSSQQIVKPLTPLLEKLHTRFQAYQAEQETVNLLQIVRWCREHHLTQQGLTLLEEGLINILCIKLNLNADDLEIRHASSGAIGIIAQKDLVLEEQFNAEKYHFTIDDLRQILPSREFVKAFERLRSARNDINHGGYNREQKPAKEFEKTFDSILNDIEDVIKTM